MRAIAFILALVVGLGIYAYSYESNNEIKEVYRITDRMIKRFKNKDYRYSYNTRHLHTKSTSEETYTVIPEGRVLKVVITKERDNEKLRELSSQIAERYRKNDIVNSVEVRNGAVRILCY